VLDALVQAGPRFLRPAHRSLWFHLPVRSRQWVALGLNLGWMAHFTTLGTHLHYFSYIAGQTWPGTFANNLPFAISILGPMLGGCVQNAAEEKLIANNPGKFPPRWGTYLKQARRKWRAEGKQSSFFSYVKAELQQFKADADAYKLDKQKSEGGLKKAAALTGIISSKQSHTPSKHSPTAKPPPEGGAGGAGASASPATTVSASSSPSRSTPGSPETQLWRPNGVAYDA